MPDLTLREWREVCPDLTIGSAQSDFSLIDFTSTELEEISEHFWANGYLHLGPLIANEEVQKLSGALDQLKAANIPPVYVYIYDQPWQLFEKLRVLIAHFLGETYALLPNFWAWHLIEPGESGWPPHHDCSAETVFDIGGENILMSLSLWVPLTDVDEANCCMFVAPKSREDLNQHQEPIALPAKAGSVLGWAQDVEHWGGAFTDNAKNPRKSLSFEFQNSAFDPLNEPLLDTNDLPSFEERLELLNAQFDKYQHIAG